jgi:hypothetical protein
VPVTKLYLFCIFKFLIRSSVLIKCLMGHLIFLKLHGGLGVIGKFELKLYLYLPIRFPVSRLL